MRQTPVTEVASKTPNRVFLVSILLFVLAAALIIGGIINFSQGSQNKSTLDQQAKEIKALVEQNKDISEQNKKLNQTNVNYAYCNAYLLARYTQTGAPIKIEDLNSCVLTVFPTGEGAPNVPAQSLQGSKTSSTATPTPNSATTKNTTNSSGSATSNQTTSPQTPTTPTATPQSAPLIQLQPSNALPLLNVVPDVNVPGILQVR